MTDKMFYHALKMACIDSLDCDIPLNTGFDIQNYLAKEHSRWGSRGGYRSRGRLIYFDRICDLPKKRNIHTEHKMPLFKRSSSGSGHW